MLKYYFKHSLFDADLGKFGESAVFSFDVTGLIRFKKAIPSAYRENGLPILLVFTNYNLAQRSSNQVINCAPLSPSYAS